MWFGLGLSQGRSGWIGGLTGGRSGWIGGLTGGRSGCVGVEWVAGGQWGSHRAPRFVVSQVVEWMAWGNTGAERVFGSDFIGPWQIMIQFLQGFFLHL